MSPSDAAAPERFAIDPVGAGMIAGVALVAGPAAIFASVWILTHGLSPAQTSPFEWIAAAIVSVVALLMIRTGSAELRGAADIRVDDRGIHQRGVSIAWAEIERVAAEEFGVLTVRGAGRELRLRTYLLRQPDALHAAIARRRREPVAKR